MNLSMTKMKRISVSQKRQITIPKEFYDSLDMGNEVMCEMTDDSIIIRPIKTEVDFSKEILSDLIREGYEAGDELIKEFTYRKSQVNTALHKMIDKTRDHKTYIDSDDFFTPLSEDQQESAKKVSEEIESD